MFQGYTLHSANLRCCQLTHSHSGQLNNNTVLNQEALLNSLQAVIACHLIINRSQTQNHEYTHRHHCHHLFFFFFPNRHIPTAQAVRTPTATEMESVTPMRLKKPTPLRPPTFSNREKTDAKQKQGDNSQACTVLSLFSQKLGHTAMQ